jgi:polar amino acid transport system substrate-binding protein
MAQDEDAARRELAPTGTLRVAIAVGPSSSALWTIRDPASGKPRGVTVDLGAALARRLGVPLQLVEFESSGEIVKAVDRNEWDVTFVPVDAERKTVLDFAPDYALGESTYMVAPGTGITTLAEVDRAGVRVVGVEGTATIRSARRTLKNTEAIGARSLDEAVDMIRTGKADAIALGRDSLVKMAEEMPGARVMEGHFHATGTAPAVAKGKPAALAYATEFIEAAKADGTVTRAFDAAGLDTAGVAPAGSRS